MPIVTNFGFRQQIAAGITHPSREELLGPLLGFVGDKDDRHWRGTGFNLIWRPNFGNQFGGQDFFLELNLTDENLSFRNITGSGIANRGSLQVDAFLGGIGYLQTISDRIDNSPQHFEPGVWLNVPKTDIPNEPTTVVRMASIPHGTTINLQGTGSTLTTAKPVFSTASITPFRINSPDDGQTNLQHFPEENTPSLSRTNPLPPGLDQAHLTNPNLFLSDVIDAQTVRSTVVVEITSDTSPTSVPNLGGGVDNIAFLTGTNTPPPAGQPNARVSRVTATFWIEEVIGPLGNVFHQLQYTQRVLLDFKDLSWPHITVATLTVDPIAPL